MEQYKQILQQTRDTGTPSSNRTVMPSIKNWGATMRFDLSKGLPLITLRYAPIKGTIAEAVWFIQGGNNTKFLNDNGCKFWDRWALTEEHVARVKQLTFNDRVNLMKDKLLADEDQHYSFKYLLRDLSEVTDFELDALEIPTQMTYAELGYKVGDLGPVYGVMWRKWPLLDGTTRDQLADVEHKLVNEPNSRRIIMSSWNPEFLPDESISPQENVLNGKQALPPCHTLIHFGTTPLSIEERLDLLDPNHYLHKVYREAKFGVSQAMEDEQAIIDLDREGIPKFKLNSLLYCRSQDLHLGTPTNLACYGLITMMLAHVHNMALGDFVWDAGDVHLYEDQLSVVDELLTREPLTLPTVRFKRKPSSIAEFTIDDIEIVDYNPHSKIVSPPAAV